MHFWCESANILTHFSASLGKKFIKFSQNSAPDIVVSDMLWILDSIFFSITEFSLQLSVSHRMHTLQVFWLPVV